jgi:hypothetical protein
MMQEILMQAKNTPADQFIKSNMNLIANLDGNPIDCSLSLIVDNQFLFVDFVDEKYSNHSVKGI